MIDIEQRTLRALEKHPAAVAQRAMYQKSRVGGDRQQPEREALEKLRVYVERRALRAPHHLEQLIRALDARRQ